MKIYPIPILFLNVCCLLEVSAEQQKDVFGIYSILWYYPSQAKSCSLPQLADIAREQHNIAVQSKVDKVPEYSRSLQRHNTNPWVCLFVTRSTYEIVILQCPPSQRTRPRSFKLGDILKGRTHVMLVRWASFTLRSYQSKPVCMVLAWETPFFGGDAKARKGSTVLYFRPHTFHCCQSQRVKNVYVCTHDKDEGHLCLASEGYRTWATEPTPGPRNNASRSSPAGIKALWVYNIFFLPLLFCNVFVVQTSGGRFWPP